MRAISAAISALLMSVLLAFAGLVPASAEPGFEAPPDNAPDRVVHVAAPAPAVAADARVISSTKTGASEVTVLEGDEFPVTPAPGETVRVIYTNAVTDVTALAGCTRSVTVNTPYILSGRLYSTAFLTISTGCASGKLFSLYLYKNHIQAHR